MTANIIKTSVLLIALSLMMTACNTLQRIEDGELTSTFDRTFLTYSKHLRWSHFRELTTFMMPEHIGPSIEAANKLKDIKVSRVTPTAWLLNNQTGVMNGDVIIDYYITSSGMIRSITQHQTWRHDDERDTWQLDNGLPDFR
jgi:hypothetical protein